MISVIFTRSGGVAEVLRTDGGWRDRPPAGSCFDELRQDSKLLASLVQRKWKASRQAYWGGKKVFVRKGYRR